MVVVKDFQNREFLDKESNNATYISLIPKKVAEKVLDYRPISFMRSTYKILSKCLATRLKEVIHAVISLEQGPFLQER